MNLDKEKSITSSSSSESQEREEFQLQKNQFLSENINKDKKKYPSFKLKLQKSSNDFNQNNSESQQSPNKSIHSAQTELIQNRRASFVAQNLGKNQLFLNSTRRQSCRFSPLRKLQQDQKRRSIQFESFLSNNGKQLLNIKIKFNEEAAYIQLNSEQTTLKQLKQKLTQTFQQQLPQSYIIYYIDSEQDKIHIKNQQDLLIFMQICQFKNHQTQNLSNNISTFNDMNNTQQSDQLSNNNIQNNNLPSLFIQEAINPKKNNNLLINSIKYAKVVISVIQGDLTEENSDVIVNPANSYLKLGGGVAGAIRNKGGMRIQKECDQIIENIGQVEDGEAVITNAGNLRARKVIHAVGPIWKKGFEKQNIVQLINAVQSSLLIAQKKQYKSISIPAISSGIFGFPKQLCAKVFFTAIKIYLQKCGTYYKKSIQEIRLCNIDQGTCDIFNFELQKFSALFCDKKVPFFTQVNSIVQELPQIIFHAKEAIPENDIISNQLQVYGKVMNLRVQKVENDEWYIFVNFLDHFQTQKILLNKQKLVNYIQIKYDEQPLKLYFLHEKQIQLQSESQELIWQYPVKQNIDTSYYIKQKNVQFQYNKIMKQIKISHESHASEFHKIILDLLNEQKILVKKSLNFQNFDKDIILRHIKNNLDIFNFNLQSYVTIQPESIDKQKYMIFILGIEESLNIQQNFVSFAIFKRQEQGFLNNLKEKLPQKNQNDQPILNESQTIELLQEYLIQFLTKQTAYIDIHSLNFNYLYENQKKNIKNKVSHMYAEFQNQIVGLEQDIHNIKEYVENFILEQDLNFTQRKYYEDEEKTTLVLQKNQSSQSFAPIRQQSHQKYLQKKSSQSSLQNSSSPTSQKSGKINKDVQLRNQQASISKVDSPLKYNVYNQALKGQKKKKKSCCFSFIKNVQYKYNDALKKTQKKEILIPSFIPSKQLFKIQNIISDQKLINNIQSVQNIQRGQCLIINGRKNSVQQILEIIKNVNKQHELLLSHDLKLNKNQYNSLKKLDNQKSVSDIQSTQQQQFQQKSIDIQSRYTYLHLQKNFIKKNQQIIKDLNSKIQFIESNQQNKEKYQIQLQSNVPSKNDTLYQIIIFEIKNFESLSSEQKDFSQDFFHYEIFEFFSQKDKIQKIEQTHDCAIYFDIDTAKIHKQIKKKTLFTFDEDEEEESKSNHKIQLNDDVYQYQWQYANDSNGFSDYNQAQQNEIQTGYSTYLKDNKKTFEITILSKQYEINFEKMEQINKSTKYVRKIKKTPLAWKLDDKYRLQDEVNISINKIYNTYLLDHSHVESFTYKQGDKPYIFTVNFQQNIVYITCQDSQKKDFKITKEIYDFQNQQSNNIDQNKDQQQQQNQMAHPAHRLVIQSKDSETNQNVVQDIRKYISKLTINKQIKIPQTVSDQYLQDLNKLVNDYNLVTKYGNSTQSQQQQQPKNLTMAQLNQITYLNLGFIFPNQQIQEDNDRQNIQIIKPQNQQQQQFQEPVQNKIYQTQTIERGKTYNFRGFQHTIQEIEDFLKNIKDIQIEQGFNVVYPSTWTSQQDNFTKVEIFSSDSEYKKVETNFKQTAPSGKVIKQIFRIQNKILWQNYCLEKEKMIKNKQILQNKTIQANEKELWHGTKNTDPSIIYNGKTGEAFDITFSNDSCLWGKGIYFAQNSKYSMDYSNYSNGNRKMLVCLVALGDFTQIGQNSSLKKPPLYNTSDPKKGSYDSVKGNTNGSDIYILYQMHVRRAYPMYEVVYA